MATAELATRLSGLAIDIQFYCYLFGLSQQGRPKATYTTSGGTYRIGIHLSVKGVIIMYFFWQIGCYLILCTKTLWFSWEATQLLPTAHTRRMWGSIVPISCPSLVGYHLYIYSPHMYSLITACQPVSPLHGCMWAMLASP